MEDKIRQYVNYQFRFDNRSDIEELKEEIIANLIDRYHEYVDKGKSSEEAYVEAIKSMGDFAKNDVNQISEEYSIKPSIPDITLMSGAILSIFGLIITLLSTLTGTIITAISILLFSGSAYYLYSYSQYLRKEYMDIEKHNLLLSKIFKYMKTSFLFWAISLSLILTKILMGILSSGILFNPLDVVQHLDTYITIYFFLFVITLIIFLLVFKNIYERLMNHYYLLTGNKELKGKISEGYQFLYGKEFKLIKTNLLLSKKFIPMFCLVTIIPQLFLSFTYGEGSFSNIWLYDIHMESEGIFIIQLISLLFSRNWIAAILPVFFLILLSSLTIKALRNRLGKIDFLVISYYAWMASVLFIYFIADSNLLSFNFIESSVQAYALFVTIIFSILLIVRKIMMNKNDKKDIR